ncbi:MAG: hypothetical protein A9183_06345 [Dehalococcoides mccartyi]|uniref:DUF503 domain-containing protein n=1 Tax=Dehalococcoides mccartyi TaxID=61435 RepID=UPI000804B319|nr:DUF503 domain-containing protein [Dehalococcoides mccartyi]OBW63445.1 MAG: hypothetical protein A9183_06345 [Dehalococcoides mccartyi]
MHSGILRLWLDLPENTSLKGKRQLVQPLVRQLRSRFNISVAEVEEMDSWKTAVIGISCISNSAVVADQLLNKALAFVTDGGFDVIIRDFEIEIMAV